jgi:hypothetical protein
MLFLASVLGSALLTLGLIIYFREHLKEQIGWYLLALCAIGAWAGWQSDGWIMLLMMPVVLWKVPPFSKEEKLFAWAASKDPLGIKAATAKFLLQFSCNAQTTNRRLLWPQKQKKHQQRKRQLPRKRHLQRRRQ